MESQPKDTVDMTNKLKYLTLDKAEGGIEATEYQIDRLDEVTERVGAGEFHKPVAGKIPSVCIDGRPGGELDPNSAGGTFSLTVADDLTTQRFSASKTLVESDREIAKVVLGEGSIVGGHCGEFPQGVNCGCGAKDKVGEIYAYLAQHHETIREQAAALGVEVSSDIHHHIISKAQERTDFSTGAELSAVLKEVAGPASESVLTGAHKEVIAAINTREGESLDRDALTEVFGDDYQAFNVDVWSFQAAADATSLTEEESVQKVVALVYYNLATAGVLCGPGMRIVTVA